MRTVISLLGSPVSIQRVQTFAHIAKIKILKYSRILANIAAATKC